MTAVSIFQKPRQLYPRIRQRSNFTEGLACVFWCNEPGGDIVEALSGVRLIKQGAGTRKTGIVGIGARVIGDGTSGWLGPAGFTPIKTSNGVGTGNFTLLMIEDPPNVATAGFHGLSQGDATRGFQSNQNSTNAGAASAGRVGFECYGTTSSFCVTGTTTNTDGTPHVKVCRQTVSGSTATLTVFVDGVKPTQSTAGTTVNDIRGGTPASGAINVIDDGEGTATAFATYFACAWNRGLSDVECQYISRMLWYELLDFDHVWNQPNEYSSARVGLAAFRSITGSPSVGLLTSSAALTYEDRIQTGPTLGLLTTSAAAGVTDSIVAGISLPLLGKSAALAVEDHVAAAPTLGLLTSAAALTGGGAPASKSEWLLRARRRATR